MNGASAERRKMKHSGFGRIALAVMAPFLILSAPFVNFIAVRGYGFGHPEVLIVFGFLSVPAAVIAAIAALRPDTLRPAVLGLLVVVFVHTELGFYAPSLGDPNIAAVIAALVYTAAILGLAWAVRNNIEAIICAAFAVIVVSTIIFPGDPYAQDAGSPGPAANNGTPDSTLPPVVHIVLDQHIGIDGLPSDIAGADDLRRDLAAFYAGYGFSLFTKAFTHFPATVESISGLLNSKFAPDANNTTEISNDMAYLRKNAWFTHLAGAGYRIDVLESRYFDYCGAEGVVVSSCLTYDQTDIRFFHRMKIGNLEKAKQLFAYFVSVDLGPILYRTIYLYHLLRESLEGMGLGLEKWNFKAISPSPLVSLDAFSRLSRRIETLKDGEAVFAHLLLPHDPFILDRNCALKPDTATWAVRNNPLWMYRVKNDVGLRIARYREYMAQVRCVTGRLAGIFEIMKERGVFDRSLVIIHGDHGSMIGITETFSLNRDEVTDGDIIDNYSTLFAIRGPGLAAATSTEQRSIQGLFAELAIGRTGGGDHGDIFLKPNTGVIGSDQVRRSMPPINPDRRSGR